MNNKYFIFLVFLPLSCVYILSACSIHEYDNRLSTTQNILPLREQEVLDNGWRFMKYDSTENADTLIYDTRPVIENDEDGKAADAKPSEAIALQSTSSVLKPWILPTANDFIKDKTKHHQRPPGNPGEDFALVQNDFDDSAWEAVTVPHDWAIAGPFYQGSDAPVGGGMGRLPSAGVAWYRRNLHIGVEDIGKSLFLNIDGAMSYAMVWLNGQLVGGWPYGYASWRVDLSPYVKFGEHNQLAIRLDNPPVSSRWYPGAGLFRKVWLSKMHPVHVAQWGTHVTTSDVSKARAKVHIELSIENDSLQKRCVSASTDIYTLNKNTKKYGPVLVSIDEKYACINAGERVELVGSLVIKNPRLWGPFPQQSPHRYRALTTLRQGEKIIDRYETRFGIRDLKFDPQEGVFVNGEYVYLKGVNLHHDLGALGAAFNVSAAKRQLKILREMGVNALRLAHNPPAVELLELTDSMGFLVVDEIFDVWERKKTPLDFHLIFPQWHEPDLRAFIRRDRHFASVIMWSVGNEVGEQYTGDAGAKLAKRLYDIVKEEDATRPVVAAMNFAKPDMPFAAVMDAISLNYQGEGIRNAPAYSHLEGIQTPPLYPAFHKKFPGKMILSSENAAALSSRGEYFFPVTEASSAPVADGQGADPVSAQVSAYELYTAPFGSSADKVFSSLAKHPYVAGGFVWSGWDYLGEPTPYYSSRSSYYGVLDLAGFKKDRYYLYQSHWRPEFPMAHILPHWNWPKRLGKITPVQVFTSGDEAELFLNGQSLGRKKKKKYQYRLRWDNVKYQPGDLSVVSYKKGNLWATSSVQTTGEAAALKAKADRSIIQANGEDLAFVTVSIVDKEARRVPTANNELSFSVEGPGELVATDNGDPTNTVSFKSNKRQAFNGLCLAVVRATPGQRGIIKLRVSADDLLGDVIRIQLVPEVLEKSAW